MRSGLGTGSGKLAVTTATSLSKSRAPPAAGTSRGSAVPERTTTQAPVGWSTATAYVVWEKRPLTASISWMDAPSMAEAPRSISAVASAAHASAGSPESKERACSLVSTVTPGPGTLRVETAQPYALGEGPR